MWYICTRIVGARMRPNVGARLFGPGNPAYKLNSNALRFSSHPMILYVALIEAKNHQKKRWKHVKETRVRQQENRKKKEGRLKKVSIFWACNSTHLDFLPQAPTVRARLSGLTVRPSGPDWTSEPGNTICTYIQIYIFIYLYIYWKFF